MSIIFKFIHPVLPITAGLFAVAAAALKGQGGPCASPLILILPVLLFGVLIGIVLSVIRTFLYFRR